MVHGYGIGQPHNRQQKEPSHGAGQVVELPPDPGEQVVVVEAPDAPPHVYAGEEAQQGQDALQDFVDVKLGRAHHRFIRQEDEDCGRVPEDDGVVGDLVVLDADDVEDEDAVLEGPERPPAEHHHQAHHQVAIREQK